MKLFSVNTKEVKALDRYGLEGSRQFPATTSTVQKMNDSLLYLAGESKKNITCRPIPGAQPGKRDLLISYLEESPDFQEELADLFGGESQSFGDADFAARTQPVLEALDGKLQTDPNLKVQILTLCSLDKGRKQISLHRRIRVKDIVQAARRWKNGSTNVPTISIFFPNKEENKDVRKLHFTPHPLDLASIVNHVWSSDSKSGFKPEFQRAITTSDAYDVFFADGPISESKIRLCFSLLLYRMSPVLARLGAVKTAMIGLFCMPKSVGNAESRFHFSAFSFTNSDIQRIGLWKTQPIKSDACWLWPTVCIFNTASGYAPRMTNVSRTK